MISLTDIAWTAAFLEGEGSFLFSAGSSPRVTAGQVQREPLERLRRLFGGNIYRISEQALLRRRIEWNRQPCSHWQLNGQPAVALMLTVWPLMSPRRKEQIAKVIQQWRSRDYVKGPWKTLCKNGHPWIPENIRIDNRQRRYCGLCHRLKGRETQQRLYAQDPERARAIQRAWREKNLEEYRRKHREYARHYAAKYPERIKARNRAAYQKRKLEKTAAGG